ncbi:MAG: FecR family protein [Anaerolineales bacterium]
MKSTLSALLLLTLWLSACTSSPANTPSIANDPTVNVPVETTPAESNNQASAEREAVVSEVENQVAVKTTADGEFIPAEAGVVLPQGGMLQTGEAGRARLDLNPEGTIVRVAPNSSFTLPQIAVVDGAPKTSIELFFGKIFILLNGGSVDVETPSGVASVRGSLLSVSFNPATQRIQATCLEGHCGLVNESGEDVDLVEGESAYIDEDGVLNELAGIDQDEIQAWLDEAPELNDFLSELPDPQDYPELQEFDTYDFDPAAYFEENPSEADGFYSFDESTTDPSATEASGGDSNEPDATAPPSDDGSGDSSGG